LKDPLCACYNKAMFFIGVFGIEDKCKEVRTLSNIVCPACGRYTAGTLYFSYTFFHFFFIPLFKWNKTYFVRLHCCGAVYTCDAQTAKDAQASGRIDFSKCSRQSAEAGGAQSCPNCGARVAPGFSYCPYCGHRL